MLYAAIMLLDAAYYAITLRAAVIFFARHDAIITLLFRFIVADAAAITRPPLYMLPRYAMLIISCRRHCCHC